MPSRPRRLGLLAVLALCAALLLGGAGCAAGARAVGLKSKPHPAFTPLNSEASLAEEPYVIGAPDLIRVTVWKHPELTAEMPVRRDGMITVPLIDDVQAAGLTPAELKASVTEKLSASIARPDVTVAVISPESQVVSVLGGVTRSGEIPLRRNMGIMQAVAAAGGFTAWANKNDIRVVRFVAGERVSYRFSYHAYMNGSPDADVQLRPGDVVVVPE